METARPACAGTKTDMTPTPLRVVPEAVELCLTCPLMGRCTPDYWRTGDEPMPNGYYGALMWIDGVRQQPSWNPNPPGRPGNTGPRSCGYCGESLEGRDSRVRYCDSRCTYNADQLRRRTAKGLAGPAEYRRACKNCGKDFIANHHTIRYCGSDCRHEAKLQIQAKGRARKADKRRAMKTRRCADCGTLVDYRSSRCATCHLTQVRPHGHTARGKYSRHGFSHCTDCGDLVGVGATRCRTCNGKHRKEAA